MPQAARDAIADAGNVVLVSAASAWEIATKHRSGKWPEVERIITEFDGLLRQSRFAPLTISIAHARRSGSLPGAHRDPFDRMLVAQAEEQGAALVSGDAAFVNYGVTIIWDTLLPAACT